MLLLTMHELILQVLHAFRDFFDLLQGILLVNLPFSVFFLLVF